MTFKKIILVVLGSIVGVVIAGMIYITAIIDPNDYKSEIVDQVEDNAHRHLVIDGDIAWRFFPNIGLTLGHTKIVNPAGFPDEPLMQFDSAQVDLAFWPLLSKSIEVGMISIHGLSLNLHTRKDGVSNLDSNESIKEEINKEIEDAQSTGEMSIESVVIEGFKVVDAKVVIENLAEGSKQTFDAINFTLGKLELDKIVAITFAATIDTGDVKAYIQSKGDIKISEDLKRFDLINLATNIKANGETLPNKKIEINIKTSGSFDTEKQYANLSSMTLSVLDIDLKGSLSASLGNIPDIKFELKGGDVDLDAILPKMTEEKPDEQVTEEAIDLFWMKSFNVKGLITLDSLKVNNLTLSKIALPIELKNAQLKLTDVKGEFYQGGILANITLDGRRSEPKFSTKLSINDVQALPLVKDLLDDELISGTMNMSAEINGRGLDDKSIRKNSKGSGQFAFTDGAIHGVNVADLIRTTYAKIKGQTIEASGEPNQTDFASFTGSFNLNEGVVKNTDLKLLSPLLRISGAGIANIIDEKVDYKLKTSVVGTLQGQGGEELKDLNSVSIPLKIKGPMADPKISLDMNDLLEDKLIDTVKDKLKDKLKKWFD